MLHALSQKHASRAQFLTEVKLNEKAIIQQQQQQQQLQANQISQRQHAKREELAASLASARGIPAPPPGSTGPASPGITSNPTTTPTSTGHSIAVKKKLTEEDPFYKFYSSINSVFTKTFNASIEKAKEEQLQQIQAHNLAHQKHSNSISSSQSSTGSNVNELNSTITSLMIPMKFDNESFYVVPSTTKLSVEELATENANLRQMINRTSIQLHAYETATKKQKDALKNNLMLLRNEFNARETARTRQHETEIEALNSEIDKLKIQIGRMKSRWDDLKESARKRREESVTDDEER